MNTPSRKIIGVVAFVVALISAIAITRFAGMRLAPSEDVAPPAVAHGAPVGFVVQQAIIDFKQRKTYTTLRLERDIDAPAQVRVWAHYFSPDEQGASWSAQPVTIDAPFADANRRIVTVTGECPGSMCDLAPRGKAAYYARIFVTDDSPEQARPAFTTRDFDITTATPVLLQGIDAPKGARPTR